MYAPRQLGIFFSHLGPGERPASHLDPGGESRLLCWWETYYENGAVVLFDMVSLVECYKVTKFPIPQPALRPLLSWPSALGVKSESDNNQINHLMQLLYNIDQFDCHTSQKLSDVSKCGSCQNNGILIKWTFQLTFRNLSVDFQLTIPWLFHCCFRPKEAKRSSFDLEKLGLPD
jgi:hypothetical protein